MKQRLIFIVIFSFSGILVTYVMLKPSDETKPLPVVNPIDVPEEMVDPELLRLGNGHRIGNFAFKDQFGRRFTREMVKGKVFVAEYFFTTCQTICPIMNRQMQRIHEEFKDNRNVELLSFTVDPEHDTPTILQEYAINHHADGSQWHFLTGDKRELYRVARKSFFLLKPAEAENQGDVGSDFIHTNNFVLVDKLLRIRGYYDGTSPKEIDRLMQDMRLLLKEKVLN
jgi:protein SCO1/2